MGYTGEVDRAARLRGRLAYQVDFFSLLHRLAHLAADPAPGMKSYEALRRDGVWIAHDGKPVCLNVAAFGACVDIGVHQDGLVHISAMAKTLVKDPQSLAKPGDIVRVKVLDIDPARRRIALTMRLDEADVAAKSARRPENKRRDVCQRTNAAQQPSKAAPVAPAAVSGAIAESLHRAGWKPGKQGSSGTRSDRHR